MHEIYGGMTKALVSLWFDSMHHAQPWYCKNKLSNVNERVQKIAPTSETTKATRSLNDRNYWKGNFVIFNKNFNKFHFFSALEYQYFLIFYSLPCMKDIPDAYYNNLKKLIL